MGQSEVYSAAAGEYRRMSTIIERRVKSNVLMCAHMSDKQWFHFFLWSFQLTIIIIIFYFFCLWNIFRPVAHISNYASEFSATSKSYSWMEAIFRRDHRANQKHPNGCQLACVKGTGKVNVVNYCTVRKWCNENDTNKVSITICLHL
jgi:hypothetical protein